MLEVRDCGVMKNQVWQRKSSLSKLWRRSHRQRNIFVAWNKRINRRREQVSGINFWIVDDRRRSGQVAPMVWTHIWKMRAEGRWTNSKNIRTINRWGRWVREKKLRQVRRLLYGHRLVMKRMKRDKGDRVRKRTRAHGEQMEAKEEQGQRGATKRTSGMKRTSMSICPMGTVRRWGHPREGRGEGEEAEEEDKGLSVVAEGGEEEEGGALEEDEAVGEGDSVVAEGVGVEGEVEEEALVVEEEGEEIAEVGEEAEEGEAEVEDVEEVERGRDIELGTSRSLLHVSCAVFRLANRPQNPLVSIDQEGAIVLKNQNGSRIPRRAWGPEPFPILTIGDQIPIRLHHCLDDIFVDHSIRPESLSLFEIVEDKIGVRLLEQSVQPIGTFQTLSHGEQLLISCQYVFQSNP
jgi:hypothetical protein